MRRLQSIGALLTALTGAMMVTIIVVCAVLANNAFQRTQQASEALSVVVLKRATLLPKTTLRNELGLARSALLASGKADAAILQEIKLLHAETRRSLDIWIAQVKTNQHPVSLRGMLQKKARYTELWPKVLAAAQKPRADRPPKLALQLTAVVDNLSDEIDRQSQALSRKFSGADAFTREMLWLNDLAWAVRADAGMDRRILARALIEQGRQKLDVATLDQLTGKINARWEIVTNEAKLPIVPVEMKTAIANAQQAYFREYRPARNKIVTRLAKGEVLSESRLDLLRISQPSYSKLSEISAVALSLTEAHAAAAKKTETQTFLIAIVAIVLSIALGCLLAAYIMQRIVWPLKLITQIMKKVADGDWRPNIPFKQRKDEIGQFSRTLQLFRDNAAEKQRLEIDLVRSMAARETAETSNRMKSEFLANMSHELRTPLNAILGFSEIIQSEVLGPGMPRYREYASDIHGAGRHLLSLINDILDLSKAEAGKLELHTERVELDGLIEECARLVRGRASEHGLRILMALRPIPAMEIDRLRIKQVLLNLLSNAIKFTNRCGTVTVEAEQIAGGDVVIRVRDTGIGIPADLISTVFEPFRQVDSTLARKFEGTGLGLSLVRTLVELHGGTVKLESAVGKGTTVSVTLPRSRSMESAGERRDGTIAAE